MGVINKVLKQSVYKEAIDYAFTKRWPNRSYVPTKSSVNTCDLLRTM